MFHTLEPSNLLLLAYGFYICLWSTQSSRFFPIVSSGTTHITLLSKPVRNVRCTRKLQLKPFLQSLWSMLSLYVEKNNTYHLEGCDPKRFSVRVLPIVLLVNLTSPHNSLLLIEFVAATASGHNAEYAIARKNKRPLPIPASDLSVLLLNLYLDSFSVLLLEISTHQGRYSLILPIAQLISVHSLTSCTPSRWVPWSFPNIIETHRFQWCVLQYVIIRPRMSLQCFELLYVTVPYFQLYLLPALSVKSIMYSVKPLVSTPALPKST